MGRHTRSDSHSGDKVCHENDAQEPAKKKSQGSSGDAKKEPEIRFSISAPSVVIEKPDNLCIDSIDMNPNRIKVNPAFEADCFDLKMENDYFWNDMQIRAKSRALMV